MSHFGRKVHADSFPIQEQNNHHTALSLLKNLDAIILSMRGARPRLRFFVTAVHTDEQLLRTVDAVVTELRPRSAGHCGNPRKKGKPPISDPLGKLVTSVIKLFSPQGGGFYPQIFTRARSPFPPFLPLACRCDVIHSVHLFPDKIQVERSPKGVPQSTIVESFQCNISYKRTIEVGRKPVTSPRISSFYRFFFVTR